MALVLLVLPQVVQVALEVVEIMQQAVVVQLVGKVTLAAVVQLDRVAGAEVLVLLVTMVLAVWLVMAE
jgi:hypothetical protein